MTCTFPLQATRVVIMALLMAVAGPVTAAIALETMVAGLSSPVFVTHAGDASNRLFIVEQAGIIRVLQPGASAATVFVDIRTRIAAGGERGLLGLAFHPHYPVNGRFFVYYTRSSDGAVVIAEYRVSSNANLADATEKILLTIPHPTYVNHNGGMLAFGPDGYLYIGVGDGGSGNDPADNAQNVSVLLGKILRIDVDRVDAATGTFYSSPADNPYVGVTGRNEIFSIGWRNPWRFSFDRATRAQWVADVGQNAHEEVDTPIVKGGNYGWRVYEAFTCTNIDPSACKPANYHFPIFDYAHTQARCSITGGYVYRGARGALPQGSYVYGDYCSGEIFAWDGIAQAVLLDTTMNISSFGEDELGELYVVSLGGSVSRIVNADATTAPVLVGVKSRKSHAGVKRDLPLSLISFNPTTEPRSGASATLVFSFDKPITAATAIVTEGSANIGPLTFASNEVIVALNVVANAQYVTVWLLGVTAADGASGGSASLRIGFLAGDVDGNRVVTLADLLLVNAVLAQPVGAANYLRDVNASGTLTISDLLVVNAHLTQVLPSP